MRLLTRKGVTVATLQDDKVYEAGEKLDLASVITVIVKVEPNHEIIEKRQKRNLATWGKKIHGLAWGERRAVRARRRRTGGRTQHMQDNLFLGTVKCGECGRPVYHQINTWGGQKKIAQQVQWRRVSIQGKNEPVLRLKCPIVADC